MAEKPLRPAYKRWIKLQWGNSYLQLFILALVLLVLELINLKTVVGWVVDAWYDGYMAAILVGVGTLIPILMILAISILGFYQYWQQEKNDPNL